MYSLYIVNNIVTYCCLQFLQAGSLGFQERLTHTDTETSVKGRIGSPPPKGDLARSGDPKMLPTVRFLGGVRGGRRHFSAWSLIALEARENGIHMEARNSKFLKLHL
jgi:hypothetical protein